MKKRYDKYDIMHLIIDILEKIVIIPLKLWFITVPIIWYLIYYLNGWAFN